MVQLFIVLLLLSAIAIIYMEARRRLLVQRRLIAAIKAEIADDTRMTAQVGVYAGADQSTVVIGVSEEMGGFYYRVVRQHAEAGRGKINLCNVTSVDLIVDGLIQDIAENSSDMPTSTAKATDISARLLSQYPPDKVNEMQRIELRVAYLSETGGEHSLELSALRPSMTPRRRNRTQILKNALWWCVFIRLAAQHTRLAAAGLYTGDEGDE
ncbi:thioredoxin [uncultured Desulfovibrio sp.]|uniref:thioredoxin n=1 Tax=uncultured Desulfovibrio sp. TaxID=167968 RepID=UPI0025D95F96|nr:thioredoxin [uncultured Desulfovibrio sp.]